MGMSNAATERELLCRAIVGDRVALQELLLIHHEALTKHVACRIPAKIQRVISTDDIVQQTYVRAVREVERFRPRTDHSFYAWLKKIGENCVLDTLRYLQCEKRGGDRRQVDGRAMAYESSMTDLIATLSAGSHRPSGSVARHEAIAAVRESIEALPADHHQAVQLHLLEGKSLKETAAIMKRSPRAVQGLLDRAKKRMRDALGRLSLYE